jgi:hypothetical protein
MDTQYVPPLSLTILGAIFLLIGAVCAAFIYVDILLGRRWRRMMKIMYVRNGADAGFQRTSLPLFTWVRSVYGFIGDMGGRKRCFITSIALLISSLKVRQPIPTVNVVTMRVWVCIIMLATTIPTTCICIMSRQQMNTVICIPIKPKHTTRTGECTTVG